MTIKTGKHVDANGKIYLPYLHEWKYVSMGKCSLLNYSLKFFFPDSCTIYNKKHNSFSEILIQIFFSFQITACYFYYLNIPNVVGFVVWLIVPLVTPHLIEQCSIAFLA